MIFAFSGYPWERSKKLMLLSYSLFKETSGFIPSDGLYSMSEESKEFHRFHVHDASVSSI